MEVAQRRHSLQSTCKSLGSTLASEKKHNFKLKTKSSTPVISKVQVEKASKDVAISPLKDVTNTVGVQTSWRESRKIPIIKTGKKVQGPQNSDSRIQRLRKLRSLLLTPQL